ncbi:MAG: TIGR00730 family Rossman fold protein [Holosporales bacterium]|jgi:uncharacterized protein (TIGR00730 family)|nr:TIGR00730 family Rossman fold protein [Holosporales bacterium]
MANMKLIVEKPNCSELVGGYEGFISDFSTSQEILKKKQKLVAVLGGGKISEDSAYYRKAKDFAGLISAAGISIVTGGGPGIMQAGNDGTTTSVSSYGLKVKDIKNESSGSQLGTNCEFMFNTLSIRLLTLIGASDAIVLFPGGFGTLEEMFSLLVRTKVEMMKKVPIYLFGVKFWEGLVSWLSSEVLGNKAISEEDFELFKIKDDVKEMSNEIISVLAQY